MDEEGFGDVCVEVVSEDAEVDEPDVDEPDVDEPEVKEPDVDVSTFDEPDVDEPDLDEPDTVVDDVSEVSEEVAEDKLLSNEECSSDAEAGREEVLSD